MNPLLLAGIGLAVLAVASGGRKTTDTDLSLGFGSGSSSTDDLPVTSAVLDRRTEGRNAIEARERNTGKNLARGGRDMAQVDGLVLHQMSFQRGDDPSRYYGVTAHYIITPDGKIVQLHDEDEYLISSNNFNPYTVAVEFAGNFPNTRGNRYKPEKFGADNVTQAQIRAGRYLIDHLINVMPRLGSPGLKYVYAHRQSDFDKSNDPGPDLWYHVGEWAIRERGLSHTPTNDWDYAVGSGQPILDSWRRPSSNRID